MDLLRVKLFQHLNQAQKEIQFTMTPSYPWGAPLTLYRLQVIIGTVLHAAPLVSHQVDVDHHFYHRMGIGPYAYICSHYGMCAYICPFLPSWRLSTCVVLSMYVLLSMHTMLLMHGMLFVRLLLHVLAYTVVYSHHAACIHHATFVPIHTMPSTPTRTMLSTSTHSMPFTSACAITSTSVHAIFFVQRVLIVLAYTVSFACIMLLACTVPLCTCTHRAIHNHSRHAVHIYTCHAFHICAHMLFTSCHAYHAICLVRASRIVNNNSCYFCVSSIAHASCPSFIHAGWALEMTTIVSTLDISYPFSFS